MTKRPLRLVCLLAAFTLGAGAFGQAVSAQSEADVVQGVPKHPIPYKELQRLTAKPKPKPKPSAPAPGALPPVAPATGSQPAPPPAAPPRPAVIPPPKGPQPAPPAAKPAAPQPAPAAKPPAPIAAPAPPRPAPEPPLAPPPPALPAPQIGARLQPGQAMTASDLEAFIDGQVAQAMSADHIAGVSVAVVQNGQLVMEKGYGAGAAHRPMDPRATLVRLGSGSQIFTWIAVLKAVEDGRLNLNAPVNSYLAEDLAIPDEGFDRPILLRHLMSQTAGFEDRALGRRYQWNADRLLSLDEGLVTLRPRRVRPVGLLSIPSAYGVALAGAAVAKAQGRPFDQLIETQILKPLGLNHTSFREPYSVVSGLPEPMNPALSGALGDGYRWTAHGFEAQPFAYGQSLAPAVAASTTADDMARLMIALLNNGRLGEASLYGPKAAAMLRAPLQQPTPGMEGLAHGLAMGRIGGGFAALSQTGVAPTFQSNLTLAPGLNLGVFIVANTDTGAGLAQGLAGAIVQRFYGATPTPAALAPAAQVQDASGPYLTAQRAYHGLEAFVDRLKGRSVVTTDGAGDLVLADRGHAKMFAPTAIPGRYRAEDGGELFTPTVKSVTGAHVQAYLLGGGGGVAERVGGLHSFGVLAGWAAATVFTVFASFAGLFIRDRLDPRETARQTTANVTQIIGCLAWCAAFFAFFMFAGGDLAPPRLMFDWPNRWLVTASWAALLAGLLSVVMLFQLPGAWRDERRIPGWSVWRKLRHTGAIAVFLIFTAVLAAWGALEPWSS
jgi:CubicO group peptidase (beta-lactamase class C family)